MENLLVFSHLRWNFVYQRPQHLMTRLARSYQVYFFEEPVWGAGAPRLEVSEAAPGVHVCRPSTPVRAPGFHDEQLAVLQTLLDGLARERGIVRPIAWLYTPMGLPLVQGLEPRAIVYDCMDELSAFRNAPKQLLQRESALLKAASLVFTGGPSLYRAKKSRHPAVHCFPSSVEKAHFAAAGDPGIEHPLQRAIAHPKLGFFGVLDERLDLGVLRQLGESHPEWNIVMVGPVVKIDPATLPQLPNIHYLGQQDYADLPRFLAGWDVCLLPFALNEATRFISPTKTLEYMAAGKPIVSTPVTDVAVPYGHIVAIGTGSQFVTACAQALRRTAQERAAQAELMRQVVDATSWDATAARMRDLIGNCGQRPDAVETTAVGHDAGELQRAAPGATRRRRIAIIGAGPTGLSAAYHAGADSVLLEQNSRVGGWCRSIEDRGFTFDYAGHIMFSNDSYVHELYGLLLGDNVHWQDREAWIWSKGVYTRYPFQGALYGLPPEVVTECILGAIEARVGPLTDAPASAPSSSSALATSPSACKAESITDCCADGIAETSLVAGNGRVAATSAAPPGNFEEFIHRVWGRGVARHFALPYNRKLWAVPLAEMETSWLGGRVPLPNLAEMIEGALRPVAKPMGPNARFGYPLRGGFQALVDGFLGHLRGELRLGARVVGIVPSEHRVELADGTSYVYEQLISTMPLPLLVRAIGAEAPPQVREAAARLRHVSVRCVNLGIGRARITEKHWIYYPESSVFHRIFVQGNASPNVNPPNGFALTCEITYSPDKPLPCDGEALIDRCIADCIDVGIIRPEDRILARNQLDMPYAYVVYDHSRAASVATIREWALAQDILLAGRYGEWEYYNSDHAFLAGRKAAERARARLDVARPRAASLTS